jgi:predicted RNA methylase
MKQSATSIQSDNLQEFLDSAANANAKGQQQFYTPANLAAALSRPLPAQRREIVVDLSFGSGNLARSSGATTALGIDIDPRVTTDLQPPDGAKWHTLCADLTKWYPLAAEVSFAAPFILLNPPFSLQWHKDRLAPLLASSIPEVASAAANFGKHADSTLASFLIALDLIQYNGEGYMVCNADTARRFFGDPSSSSPDSRPPTSDLRKFIWLWLEIPGAIYEGQHTAFDTAVLYFSKSHGQSHGAETLHLTAPSPDPLAVERTLMVPEVFNAHRGSRIHSAYECHAKTLPEEFREIATEYAARHRGAKPRYNIRLDGKGEIRTFLTPFQKSSVKLDRQLIGRLHALDGSPPISLCVTATSRTMLREAMQCGAWTVEPAVVQAVTAALAEYEREGAPFYRPNEIQSLGWIDEHGELECRIPGIGSCEPGKKYTIASTIEETLWEDTRTNLMGEKEDLKYTGRELLVTLTDPDGIRHHFHVRKDDKEMEDDTDRKGAVTACHWHISDLVKHFHIPIPADIATLRPDEYAANLARIKTLEQIINANVAA